MGLDLRSRAVLHAAAEIISHSEGNSENQNAERKAQESVLMRVPRMAKALGNCVLTGQGRLNSKIIA